MSATWSAGQKVRASQMAPQRLWTVMDTVSAAAVGTTETLLGTAPSSTYRNGGAWRLTFRGLTRSAVGATEIGFAIRDTSTVGTSRKQVGFWRIPAASVNYENHWEHIVANASGSDITGRVLVLTYQSSSGVNTAFVGASATIPWYWSADYIGDSDDFPEAVLL